MTDENTMDNTNDKPATDLPPAPNGHGAGNGAASESVAPTGANAKDAAAKDTQPSSKKKKKKKRHAHAEKPATGQVEPAAVAEADQPATTIIRGQGLDRGMDRLQMSQLEADDFIKSTTAPSASTEPTGTTVPTEPAEPTPSSVERATAPSEEPTAAPVEESLRLRMKTLTDPSTGKRYLAASAFMRDLDAAGRPVSDIMHVYATRDGETKCVTLTAAQWNALPFSYFQEDGPAPRVTAQPVDAVVLGGTIA